MPGCTITRNNGSYPARQIPSGRYWQAAGQSTRGDHTLSIVRPDRFRFSSILRYRNNGQRGFDRFLPGYQRWRTQDFSSERARQELGIYDAVNVGAAGTLVIRKHRLRAKFLAEFAPEAAA